VSGQRPGGRGHRHPERLGTRRQADPARAAALDVLRAVADDDAYANLVLPRILRAAGLAGRDAAFATELAYGALRGRGTYDAVLTACIDRPLADVDPVVLDLVRLGAHQLLSMRVPEHAAVAATVDLARVRVGAGASGFVNAVLRRVAGRDRQAWLTEVAPDDVADPDGNLAVRFSHPRWVVRALRDGLRTAGRPSGELPALLAADNAAPVVTVAALPGLAEPGELVGHGGTGTPASPVGVAVQGRPDALAAVREGRARVQDEGSQLVALALAAAELEGADAGRWLDVCAGPGGKAALLGAVLRLRRAGGRVPADARLVAVEVLEHRTALVRQAVRTLGDAVEVRHGDGREVDEDGPGHYDRVLVDAPCTGLGALRRRPEARWRRQPEDLAALGPLQRALLAAALRAVRPGGVVGYVTCSPHPAETGFVVDDVLRTHGHVVRTDARGAVAAVSRAGLDLGDGPDVQLWPHVHGTDAMFLALLRRTG
jgi:16S rRNA (cytosine967-C5)-methyltransferase